MKIQKQKHIKISQKNEKTLISLTLQQKLKNELHLETDG